MIAELLAAWRQQERDALAREGYRFFARESEEFAEASGRAVAEAIGDERPPR